MNFKLGNLIVILFLSLSTSLWSATYYISPSGNDTSGAGSFSNPWATVYKGCSSMSAGDTLVLKDGTYTGDNNMFTFGSAGHYPPSGTSTSNYTTIKAENPGGATIDGEGVRQPFNGHDSDFLIIDGIVFKNSNGSVWAMVGNSGNYCTYLKITRCGFCDANSTAANPRCNNIEIRWGDYVLMEDCYTWGNGKYRFYVLDSNRVILRRCVDRLDRGYGDGSLMGSFRLYGANNCILQNCISIDSDQKEYIRDSDSPVAYASPKMIWFGANGSTGNTCNNNQVIGSMIVSCTANSFIGFIGTDSSVTGNSLTNCAFWNVSNEFWTRVPSASQVTTFTNCTFGNIMAASHASAVNSSEVQNGGLVTNSIVYNAHSAALANVSSNYNCLYGNTAGNYSGGSAGVNDYCAERGNAINPIYGTGNLTGGLKYVPRIESNSNLSGKANGGGAIGASIIKQTGVTGTLYGEAGYNVVTASNLWPFPYEDIIRTKMKAYNAGGVSGNRGFCAEGTTLTKYIWEYLGNPMPAEIYTDVGLGTLPSAPLGLSAAAQSSRAITLSWNANASDHSGVKIERKSGINGSYSKIAEVGVNVQTYNDVGLAPNTTYYYRVRAYNVVGDSPYSNEASAVTLSFSEDVTVGKAPLVTTGEIRIVGSSKWRGVINPDEGETAKIYFKGSNVGKFEVKIFTLTGELVWEQSMDNVSEGMFEWSPKNVASGGYIVYLKGPGVNVNKKIAILR
jgi:hypothetical protein